MSDNIAGVKADMISISVEEGRPTLPSFAKMQTNGDPPFVGSSAIRKQYPHPLETFYDAKRLFGMKMSDQEIVRNLSLWSFKLVADDDDNPLYIMQGPKGEEKYRPEKVSSFVLNILR